MDYNKIELRFKNQKKSKTFNNILNNFNLSSKAVLDVGCSYGEFLINFGNGSIGLTVSQEEADYGQNRELNIQCLNIEEEELKDKDKSFDVIFANNIFEHLYSPHNFLCLIKKYLKNEGILILGVPCVPGVKSLVNLKKFRGSLASGHINFFTKYTLENTVTRAGWNILDSRGFHFKSSFLDNVFSIIYPHFYIVAKMDNNFQYSGKRKNELLGYRKYKDAL